MSNQIIINEQNQVVTVDESHVSVTSVGIQGPPGAGGDKNFSQTFSSTATVTVTHNLGKFPSVSVLDSANDECEGSVQHISVNQLVVTFSAPFSGTVLCN